MTRRTGVSGPPSSSMAPPSWHPSIGSTPERAAEPCGDHSGAENGPADPVRSDGGGHPRLQCLCWTRTGTAGGAMTTWAAWAALWRSRASLTWPGGTLKTAGGELCRPAGRQAHRRGGAVPVRLPGRRGAGLPDRQGYAGSGYGTEAFAAVADWGLYKIHLSRVVAKCYKENQASYKMLSPACGRRARTTRSSTLKSWYNMIAAGASAPAAVFGFNTGPLSANSARRKAEHLGPGHRDRQKNAFRPGPPPAPTPGLWKDLSAAEDHRLQRQDAQTVLRRRGRHSRYSGPKLWGSSSSRVKVRSSPAPFRQMISMLGRTPAAPGGTRRRDAEPLAPPGDDDADKVPMPLADGLGHRRPLGADGGAEGGVFDVAAGEHRAVAALQGGAHGEVE